MPGQCLITQIAELSPGYFCGERGIRTPGGVTLNGFQDRRNRPLCHLSMRWSQFECKFTFFYSYYQMLRFFCLLRWEKLRFLVLITYYVTYYAV